MAHGKRGWSATSSSTHSSGTKTRAWTFEVCGFGFDVAIEIFGGIYFEVFDDRFDYGELRLVSTGFVEDEAFSLASGRRANETDALFRLEKPTKTKQMLWPFRTVLKNSRD